MVFNCGAGPGVDCVVGEGGCLGSMKTLGQIQNDIRKQQLARILLLLCATVVLLYSIVISYCFFDLVADYRVLREFRRDLKNAEIYILGGQK